MIVIDYKDTSPIYEQIVDKLQTLIIKGVFEPDSQMPSVRSLAMELSINPNTIQKSYAELERRGFIYTVKGRGNFVSPNRGDYIKFKIKEISYCEISFYDCLLSIDFFCFLYNKE